MEIMETEIGRTENMVAATHRRKVEYAVKADLYPHILYIGIQNRHNLEKCYNQEVSKYLASAAEIKDVWHEEKVEVLLLTIATTGIVPKTLTANGTVNSRGVQTREQVFYGKRMGLSPKEIIR